MEKEISNIEMTRLRQESLNNRVKCFDRMIFPKLYPMKVSVIDYCYTERMVKEGRLNAQIFLQFHCPAVFAGILADWEMNSCLFLYQGIQYKAFNFAVSTEIVASPFNNMLFKTNVFQAEAARIYMSEKDIDNYPEFV